MSAIELKLWISGRNEEQPTDWRDILLTGIIASSFLVSMEYKDNKGIEPATRTTANLHEPHEVN